MHGKNTETSLGKLITTSVRCTVCGAGYGKCDCWKKCSCGWSYRNDGKDTCHNPNCGGDGRLVPIAVK